MPILVGSGMRQIVYAATVDPGSITNGTTLAVNVTVPQSVPGQFFLVQAPSLEDNLILQSIAYCSTAGTVVIRIGNISGAPVNPASQTINLIAL